MRSYFLNTFIRPLGLTIGAVALVLIAPCYAGGTDPASATGACDSARGKQVFNKCRACHTTDPGVHMMGPSLAGIYGGIAGSSDGFNYTPAMQQAEFTWDDEKLNGFLENPMRFLPGNAMPFGGIKDASEREALICFLQTAK